MNTPKKNERLEPEFSRSIFGFHLSWVVDVFNLSAKIQTSAVDGNQ